MDAENKAREEIADEIGIMVDNREFQDEKREFSSLTHGYAERAQQTEDYAWDIVKRKIIEFLPDYLTNGLIQCSLETISGQEACRKAVASNEKKLTLRPGNKFPRIQFPTFYPYLEFILRAGPVDLWRMKKTFKVEGSMSLKDATINFQGDKIENVSGTIQVSVKISLCKGTYAVKLHQFEKPIHVA